jgi:hypothetical protein
MFIQDVDIESKLKKFNNALLYIQKEHHYWFESRYGEFLEQDHDMIFNHLFFEVDTRFVRFHFFATSDLPINIRRDCQIAFNEIFHT